jgi:DNA-binding protein HU-beta
MSESKKAAGANANVVKRADVIAAMVEKAGMQRARALAALDAFQAVITESLAEGKEVRLTGFGNFGVSDRKAGKGRDPRSGAEIDIPASKTARFRPSKQLKDALNGGGAEA